MRRWIVVFIVMGVIAGACAGDSGGAPSTGAVSSTSGSTATTSEVVEPTTTVHADTPTTGIDAAWPGVDVLVTNDDGVFLIDSEGEVTQLVWGRVAYAVDDTRGGLLFQVERGRTYHGLGSGLADSDTRVWWVPRGMSEARELLVPEPGVDQALALYDALEAADGRLLVVYVRSDDPPDYRDEDAWYPGIDEDRIDRLRIFDVDGQSVAEAAAMHIFEQGMGEISAGGGQIVALLHNQVGQDCALFDPSTAIESPESPAQGLWATSVWIPWIEAGCEGYECPDICTLSPSGELFGYTLAGQTQVLDTALGVERLVSDGRLIDLSDTHALVADGRSVMIVSIDDPTRTTTITVAGHAHLAKSPVDIRGPVIPSTPAAIQLRADGLGVVEFGDPVDEVMEVLTSILGSPTSDDFPFPGESPFVGEYFRNVHWNSVDLRVFFTDSGVYADPGVPVLSSWALPAFGPGEWVEGAEPIRTVEGIGLGSTSGELLSAYGERVTFYEPDECDPGVWWFTIEAEEIEAFELMVGSLSADPSESDSVVGQIVGGLRMGRC